MREVRVPIGFDFALDPDLDLSKIGQTEIESAYRLCLPRHQRTGTFPCSRNCRENPGCFTFLGEETWLVGEDEEEEDGWKSEVRRAGIPAGLVRDYLLD